MKLSDIHKFIVRGCKALLCISALSLPLAGCESIYEDEGDCPQGYNVAFTYFRNMKGVDAFSSDVRSLSLYVFDQKGRLVLTKSESGEALSKAGYRMRIGETEIAPGTYDLIVWGGLEDSESFELSGGNIPVSKEELVCRLNRLRDGAGSAYSERQLDALFYGKAFEVEFENMDRVRAEATSEPTVATIDLTKNTNTVRLILHNKDGRVLDEGDFRFRITDDNGLMNWDNNLLADETITYHEWTKKSDRLTTPAMSRAGEEAGEVSGKPVYCVVAEIDMSRLVREHNPVLTVEFGDKEKPIIHLSLMELLLESKGAVRIPMSNQEFLDRQDEYNMYFQLDNNNDWDIGAGLWINSWHVIFNDQEL